MRKQDWIPASDLHQIFILNDDGTLIWKAKRGLNRYDRRFNTLFAGKIAGSTSGDGYRRIGITFEGMTFSFLAHDIVWAMVKGDWVSEDRQLDHKNGDHDDNRFSNLRECSQGSNVKNRLLNADNTTGFKGLKVKRGVFEVYVNADNKRHYVGSYRDPIDAARAYDAAAIMHHGEFAKTNAALGLL
jgi:hypothetical protein